MVFGAERPRLVSAVPFIIWGSLAKSLDLSDPLLVLSTGAYQILENKAPHTACMRGRWGQVGILPCPASEWGLLPRSSGSRVSPAAEASQEGCLLATEQTNWGRRHPPAPPLCCTAQSTCARLPTSGQRTRLGHQLANCSSHLAQASTATLHSQHYQRAGKTNSGLHVRWRKATRTKSPEKDAPEGL